MASLQLSDTQMLMSQEPCYHNTHVHLTDLIQPQISTQRAYLPAHTHACRCARTLTHTFITMRCVCCNGTTSAVRVILPCPCFCFPPLFSPISLFFVHSSFFPFCLRCSPLRPFIPLILQSTNPPLLPSPFLFLLSQSFSLHCSL